MESHNTGHKKKVLVKFCKRKKHNNPVLLPAIKPEAYLLLSRRKNEFQEILKARWPHIPAPFALNQ